MVRVPPWLRFTLTATPREWARFLAKAGAIGLVTGLVALFLMVEITERPRFCRTCHIMEPYYDGWATSTHKDVDCIECHYEPGLRSTVAGKFQGIRQVVVYFTGGAGTRPWAEIADASCLRSGCHETRLLDGLVDFDGIKFDHKPHLEPDRRGKTLRCVSCHSQVVMGEHITVTTSTCVLCHFKDRPAGEPIAGCLGCHEVPADTITLPGDRPYVHREIVDRGVGCVSCHASATVGDGFVPKARCYTCHNIPIDGYLEDPEFLHRKHVAEHKVECTDCHLEITHGYESERRTAQLDCRGCHVGMHEAVVRLQEGTAAEVLGDSKPHVGPMLAARVECVSCHTEETGGDRHRGVTMVGSKEGCVECHGERGDDVLADWRAYFARRIPEVERAVRASRAPAAARGRAREALDLVRYGEPVHNPSLARDLLDAAERLARGEEARVRRPVHETRTDSGLDCTYCHLEAPERTLPFQGLSFVHRPHVRALGISCDKCHANAPATFPQGETASHGEVRLTPEDCRACHHRQTRRCQACHGAGPAERVEFHGALFPHDLHVGGGLECSACHGSAGGVGVGLSACAECHADGLPAPPPPEVPPAPPAAETAPETAP